jgi:alkaline phosphatase D
MVQVAWPELWRRGAVRRASRVAASLVIFLPMAAASETRQATGLKIGEVTEDSAIVWMRLTQAAARDPADGSCPGAEGRVRVRYGLLPNLSDAVSTAWVDVDSTTDCTHEFLLTGLQAESPYYVSAETAGPGGTPAHAPLAASFATAPPESVRAAVTFTVVTGQQYEHLDAPDGYRIYDAMLALAPDFIVPTGDTVYYDKSPDQANTPALARWKWHRMYSLPELLGFHLGVPGYWEKDDHDTLKDDCWPGQTYGALTFAEGQAIFREQVPMGALTYRRVRWGRGLEVWLVEGRDFRSPNTDPDGPDKTIWGAAQKQWLKDTMLASDADWRLLVSPTPIVGPDRSNKSDNHANSAFRTEGDEIRSWIHENVAHNTFICCGDRHWQYHSKYPGLEVHEFSCGPASDVHAGGSPGEDPAYHLFHRVAGGFLSVSVRPAGTGSAITFRLHDVDGNVVFEHSRGPVTRNEIDAETRDRRTGGSSDAEVEGFIRSYRGQ